MRTADGHESRAMQIDDVFGVVLPVHDAATNNRRLMMTVDDLCVNCS